MSLNYYSESETKDVNPDAYFMRQALIEAQKAAERDEVPVGAVVVCQGRIIARGHNLTDNRRYVKESNLLHPGNLSAMDIVCAAVFFNKQGRGIACPSYLKSGCWIGVTPNNDIAV